MDGSVITADALHQREHAECLVSGKEAQQILVLKKNQLACTAQIKNLAGATSRPGDPQRNGSYGGQGRRTSKATASQIRFRAALHRLGWPVCRPQ